MGCGCSSSQGSPAASDAMRQIMTSALSHQGAPNDSQATRLEVGSTTSSDPSPDLPTWTRTIGNVTTSNNVTGAVVDDDTKRSPHGREQSVDTSQVTSEARRSREPSEHSSWATVASRRRTVEFGGSVSGMAGTRTPRTDCSPSFERALLESPVLLDEQRRAPSFELAECNFMNCDALFA